MFKKLLPGARRARGRRVREERREVNMMDLSGNEENIFHQLNDGLVCNFICGLPQPRSK